MKKYAILLNIILCFLFNYIQAQDLKNIVTSIEIGDVLSDTVILRWKTDTAQADFTIYYHTSRISDISVLKEAELAIKSNFEGIKIDSYYEYEYTMKFNKSGSYYFAIIANDSTSFDIIARDSVNKLVKSFEQPLLPEINTTIQPVSIFIEKNRSFQQTAPVRSYSLAYTITSLDLQSYEDTFHLKWNVYPKDLPQYIFTIYRSRYPIAQYNSAEGLPVYATVTNQFAFEDRNISFETPYYYAVVIQGSKQWTSGINIFTTPAVLLRKSPPLKTVSKTEYIKRKEPLPFYPQELFSEKDIEDAVQRTLSNLQILADTNNNQSLLDQLNGQNSIVGTTIFEDKPGLTPTQENLDFVSPELFPYNNINLLTRVDSEIKTMNPFAINNNFIQKRNNIQSKYKELISSLAFEFTNEISKNRKISLEHEEDLGQNLLFLEKQDYDNIMKNIIIISNEIDSHNTFTKSLLYMDTINITDFKSNLNVYYDKRDNIRIKQYQISGHIKGLDQRRQKRENDLLTSLQNIPEEEVIRKNNTIVQYNKKYNQIITNYHQDIYELSLKEHAMIINDRTQKINELTTLLGQYQDQKKNEKLNHIVSGISLKMAPSPVEQKDINLNNIDQQIAKLITTIEEEKRALSTIPTPSKIPPKQQQTVPVKREYFSGFDENQYYPQRVKPKTRISNIQHYYQEVTIEKIPEIKDNPKETWVYENKETWISKQEQWKIRTRIILGENYEIITSKWMAPSYTVAVSEGRKAYNMGQHQEAIYLLNFATKNKTSLMMLGQSYYQLGAYRDAFSVFITALNMGIPEARYWLDNTSEKILERKITENRQ